MTIFKAEAVCFSFPTGPRVLDRVSFGLEPGEMLGVIGPNGSGKSTLIRLLSGVLKPESGRILVHSKPVHQYGRKELAQKIAVVPQQSEIAFSFKVLEVVLMGRSPHLGRFQLEGKKDLELAQKALAETDCLEFADRRIDEISGGERQRVILARALAQEPEILLADEPTTFLDLHHQIRFMRLLSELRKKAQVSVLFTTHDLNLASIFADQILVLDRGKVAAFGTPSEVLTKEMISAVYQIKPLLVPGIYPGRPLIFPEL